jgi:hypothetical protein
MRHTCERESFGARQEMVLQLWQTARRGKLAAGRVLLRTEARALRKEEDPDGRGIVKQLVQFTG